MRRCAAVVLGVAMMLLGSTAGGAMPAGAPPVTRGGGETATSRSAAATAPAATPGTESLADMKARLARLKEEALLLEAKIAAAEGPTAGAEPPIIAQLNALPKDLWPVPGEQEPVDKTSNRGKWIAANVKQTGTSFFSGKVLSVRLAGGATQVELDGGKYKVWGEECSVQVSALFETSKPLNAGEVKVGDTISVAGFLKDWHSSSKNLTITVIAAKLNAPATGP
jgi:hypothetical protein